MQKQDFTLNHIVSIKIETNINDCCKASGTEKYSYQVYYKGCELLFQEPGKDPS